jgi:hypothetical protein
MPAAKRSTAKRQTAKRQTAKRQTAKRQTAKRQTRRPRTPSQQFTMWLNHLDLLPGDPSVTTSFDAVQSHGLILQSLTTGEIAPGGGNKVVEMGIDVPPTFMITGVRVCYQLTNPRSFISQIRLAQTQDPPGTQLAMLDDGTDQTNPGPVCVDSEDTSIDPSAGAISLSLRLNFGDTADQITVFAIGLRLQGR